MSEAATQKAPYSLAAVVGAAAFMEVLDTSIANVSLGHIASSLSAGPEEATWVLTSYLIANAIVLPMTGWLSDTFGRKRYYIGSMVLFTLASVLCGIAQSLPMLIVARIIQGLAGGALQPVSQAILTDAFPGTRRSTALAIYGMAVITAPTIGPTIGGYITDQFSWHWIFLINAPVGVLLVGAAMRVIHDPPEQIEAQERRRSGKFRVDYLGMSLVILGMGAMQVMLDKGQQEDWLDSGMIRLCLFVTVAALSLLVWWELRHPHPIINLRLLANRNFGAANVMILGMGLALLSAVVMPPQFMQTLLGYSALDAGIVLSPGALLLTLLMPLSGRLSVKVDPRISVCAGFTLIAISMWMMASYINLDVSKSQLIWLRMTQIIGLVFLMVPINVLAYVDVPPGQSGNAAAIINMTRNIGNSIGISIVTTLLARNTQAYHAQLVDRVSPLDPAYQETMRQLTQSMGSESAAHASIANEIQRQAMTLSYTDDFRFLAAVVVVLALLPWLARRPQHAAPPPVDVY